MVKLQKAAIMENISTITAIKSGINAPSTRDSVIKSFVKRSSMHITVVQSHLKSPLIRVIVKQNIVSFY